MLAKDWSLEVSPSDDDESVSLALSDPPLATDLQLSVVAVATWANSSSNDNNNKGHVAVESRACVVGVEVDAEGNISAVDPEQMG